LLNLIEHKEGLLAKFFNAVKKTRETSGKQGRCCISICKKMKGQNNKKDSV